MSVLAAWKPDDLVEVHLFDANEERLDLVDRFLRAAMERADTEHTVKATTDLEEALERASDVVITLHEDCARRMQGMTPPRLYVPEDPTTLEDQVRGDPNKPTHPDRLSQLTHTILSLPSEQKGTREEAIAAVLPSLMSAIPDSARVLSLLRNVPVPSDPRVLELAWPDEVPDQQRPIVPHQILRWIDGESSLQYLLDAAPFSPFFHWLGQAG